MCCILYCCFHSLHPIFYSGGLELFKGFLKSEFSEENLEFWIACEDYRCSSEASMAIIGQKIHSDFVAFHAPKQVYIYIS